MELVKIENGQILTSSLVVAEIFGKEHKNVLRDIENVIGSDSNKEFNRLKIEPIEYLDGRKRKQKAYALTRNGFSLIAMGFTGKEATDWKIKYINAFEQMEKALLQRSKEPLLNTKIHLQRYESNKPNIPKGYFCMLKEVITEVIMPLELDGKDLISSAMPGGSMGIGFPKFLKEKGIDISGYPKYKQQLTNGKIVDARAYPYTIYHLFKEFIDIWIKDKGKQYFTEKTILLLNK
jgi:Rha family phage regulatory protein